jgi:anti-anti-sigma regulatory factor
MRLSNNGNLVVENVKHGVRVMRFVRPDLRRFIDDQGDAVTSPLFQEMLETAIVGLEPGWTLVAQLGLVEPLNTAFYRSMLAVRDCLIAQQCQLVVCGLTPRHQELFDLFQASRVFAIAMTESDACRKAREFRGTSNEPARGSFKSRPGASAAGF